jgi:hypothetical protein
VKEQIRSLNQRIEWLRETLRERTKQLEFLEAEKRSYYRDSGLMPLAMLTEPEKNKILKMPFADLPCEFCGKLAVKKGKKSICLECGHWQT